MLLLYIVIVAAVAAHHEPWRDEADPWLLARDADPFAFFHHMGLSGTPGLWHVMLVPLARSGLPYGSQTVLHVLIAICTAAVVLWKAPFPPLLRIALVFSYYLAYEYAVVVRSYAAGVLLLVLLAATYRRRYEKPVLWGVLVALLANTNTHSLIIAAIIGVTYVSEGAMRAERWRGIVRGAALMIAGGLAAAVQLYPPPDAIIRGLLVMRFTPRAVPLVLSAAFFPTFSFRAGALAGTVVIAVAAFSIRRHRGSLLVLFGSYAGLAYVYTYKWIGGLRHAGFVLLVLVYALWTAAAESAENDDRARVFAHLMLTLTLAISICAAAFVYRLDILYAFSGAEEMATFIHRARLDALPIAAHSETTTSALCPWFRQPFWYAGSQRFGTFTMWDQRFERGLEVTYPDAVAAAKRQFAGRDYLLLLNVEMPDPGSNGFALLRRTNAFVFAHPDERFWLYRPVRR